MLSLGFQTVSRWSYLDGYTETKTSSGSCAGADFRCGPRPEDGGVFSCRPCTTAVMSVFKSIQTQLNRLVLSRGLSRSLILQIDGRIGPDTVKTARAVKASGLLANLPPGTEAAARYIAVNAEAVEKEARAEADKSKNLPAGTATPGTSATGPATPGAIPPTPVRRSRVGVVVGVLAGLTALGLGGAAFYSKKRR